ncbi:MarR family transcriptional regulator [Microlunatus panaciterrae]|uniref:DNA-binding MarR family transcriptional regulator n=1 Tax=Microlunatus panaciterrae TaxID=400768 RepID=A0ABS2RPB5_9ACTN|nr:DNA-binding MarR family transcriptional regulator [Microlunatus panaciterrae]
MSHEHNRKSTAIEDVDAVTDAVLNASRLLVAVSARSIASVDETITIAQFRLLVVLQMHGPLKSSTLADHLDVNPSTATRMLDRLVSADLVDRRANPDSRRELLISLTTKGERVVAQVTDKRRSEISNIVRRMPAETRTELVRALTAFTTFGDDVVVGNVPWL